MTRAAYAAAAVLAVFHVVLGYLAIWSPGSVDADQFGASVFLSLIVGFALWSLGFLYDRL